MRSLIFRKPQPEPGKRDPAPSRWAYRMQRLWLTPVVRRMARVGLPTFLNQLAMVLFSYVFFEHTLLGKKLQATSQDKDMARLLGIPVALMISITFVYSAVLGGLAGVLVGPILFVSIGMGSIIALKAFAATIIGGFGDVTGAIVGGLLLGVIESLAAYHISVPYKDAYAFLALFIFLLFRPSGIFGEKVSEKA